MENCVVLSLKYAQFRILYMTLMLEFVHAKFLIQKRPRVIYNSDSKDWHHTKKLE